MATLLQKLTFLAEKRVWVMLTHNYFKYVSK